MRTGNSEEPIDNRTFIYLDALLADFSTEISIIKNRSGKMASASGQPAATTFKFSWTNRRLFNNNH